jgi:protein-S-isoprenylcysteine O-methyltransferase Ste14
MSPISQTLDIPPIHNLLFQCSVIASLLAELVACLLLETYSHHHHQFPLTFLRVPKYLSLPSHTSALPPTFVLGCLTTAASGALRWACYKTLGSLFTFELTLREDHRLVTNGPYAFVRHPSYSGVVLGVVGTLLVHFGPASWWARAGWLGTLGGQVYAFGWCLMEAYVLWSILCRAPTEDEFLRKQFGAEWDAWAERVPYRVIPGVF